MEPNNKVAVQSAMRKNLIASGLVQLFISIFLTALAWIVVNVLRLDMIVPYITVANAGIWYIVGGISASLCVLQMIYAIIYPKIIDSQVGIVLGYIFGIFMLLFLPTGTFFGILFLQELKNPIVGNVSKKEEQSEEKPDLQEENIEAIIGNNLIMSGVVMFHQPIFLMFFNFFLLTLPLDMAHPIITSDIYAKWDLAMYIFIGLFALEIIAGVLYRKFGKEQWMKIIAIVLAIFTIVSFGIGMGLFLGKIGPNLEIDGLNPAILGPLMGVAGLIVGTLLNPLGIYLGANTLKSIKHLKR